LTGERSQRLVAGAQRELKDLSEQLLAPLAAHLGDVQRLIVSPQGALNRVPFHALWDGEEYLIEHFEMSTVPSASLLAHFRAETQTCSDVLRALFIAVADEQAPMIEQEADYLQQRDGRFEMTQLVGNKATRAAVVANLSSAGLIHLASHARFVAANPVASGVRLADGWLTVREISELQLKARLVVLSGCETGLTRVQSGEELSGLLRSLLTAGAKSAMASLWRVHDASGAALLRRFYEHWLQEGADVTQLRSPAHALGCAMRDQLREQPHPALWAPFTLVGLS